MIQAVPAGISIVDTVEEIYPAKIQNIQLFTALRRSFNEFLTIF